MGAADNIKTIINKGQPCRITVNKKSLTGYPPPAVFSSCLDSESVEKVIFER